MPDITFEIERAYISGRRTNKFYPTTDPDEVTVNENCKVAVTPLEVTVSGITLSIGLVYTGFDGSMFFGDFDVTCSVTNNTGFDVDVTLDPNDFTWDGGVPITWNTVTETIASGATGTAITGFSNSNSIFSARTIEGFVTAASNPAGNGTWTSNTDSASAP